MQIENHKLSDRPLSQSDLSSLLASTFLRGVCHFEETDSTNGQATRWLASDSKLETPCLIYAESQTAGRGRGANRWWSQAGSLTFSVIVDLEKFGLTPNQQIKLPLLTGLAVLRTGQALTDQSANVRNDFALKWPNDVYLAGRKLAGILIEVPSKTAGNSAETPAVHAVIGVGLNVNNSWENAPDDLRTKGISLSDHAGSSFDRLILLEVFLKHLETLIKGLADGLPVLDDWSDHCLLTGKQVTLLVGDQEVSGECLGLAPTGALMLQTDQGTQEFLGGIVKSWT